MNTGVWTENTVPLLSKADRGWSTSRFRALVAYLLIPAAELQAEEVAKCLARYCDGELLVSRYSQRMAEGKETKKQVTVFAKYCLK